MHASLGDMLSCISGPHWWGRLPAEAITRALADYLSSDSWAWAVGSNPLTGSPYFEGYLAFLSLNGLHWMIQMGPINS